MLPAAVAIMAKNNRCEGARGETPLQHQRLMNVPQYYFHLFNDETILDKEGAHLPNAAVALQKAAFMAREMAAESVREGRLVLAHRIEVTDDSNHDIGIVHFRDVVEIRS
jgi:hypothetical protein